MYFDTIELRDSAHGQPLKPEVKETTVVGNITQLTVNQGFWKPLELDLGAAITYDPTAPSLGDVKHSAVSELERIVKKLETDIAYFNTFRGQSMAINEFAFLKQDLLKVIKTLDKI